MEDSIGVFRAIDSTAVVAGTGNNNNTTAFNNKNNSNAYSSNNGVWSVPDRRQMGESADDVSVLMCHESSPIDEEIVYDTSVPTTSSPSPSSSGAADCDVTVPISVALAGLDSSSEVRRSFADPVLLLDRRVLAALLSMDDQCLPSAHYFKYMQPDLLPFMRRMVVAWMLEVSGVNADGLSCMKFRDSR
jgi:hypothetical protein